MATEHSILDLASRQTRSAGMSPNAGEAQLPRCSTPITPCDGVIANANLQLGLKLLSPVGQTLLGPVGCWKKIRVVLRRGEVEAYLKDNTNMLVTPSTCNGSGCSESVSSESLSLSSLGDDDWTAAFKKGTDGKHIPYWISDAWNLDARDVHGVLNRVMKCKSLRVENPGSFARLLLVQQRIKEGCMAQKQPSLLHFCLGVKKKILNVNEKQMMHVIKGLLRLGLDPNAKDREGNTPLHLAVSRGGETCFVICLALIHAGASIDTRNADGKEPFEGLQACPPASVRQPSSHPDHKLSLRAVETLKQQRSHSLASLAARELWTPVLARIRRRGGVRTSELQETFGRRGGVSRTAEEWARHYNKFAVANEIQILGRNIPSIYFRCHLTTRESLRERSRSMDGKEPVVRSPSGPSVTPPLPDAWVSERTTYDFAVAGNKSLAQAMMSVVQNPRYNADKDKNSQHGPATETRGPTLLHVFARNGWTELVVDLITRRGLHPDETPSDGPWFTPLYHAIAAGHQDLAVTLLNHGADVSRRGMSSGLMNALVGLPPENFDRALRTILTAVAQKMGKEGNHIAWALWQISTFFAKMAPYYPRRITDSSPMFMSMRESVRGTIIKLAKVEKDTFDVFCGIVWDMCGCSEAPLQMAVKAGSILGVVLFVALGFHEGLYEFGSNGRTALMEACAAVDDSYGKTDQLQRLLTIIKFLLAVARVDPNVCVPRVKRAGGDVGKYALNFVPCDIGAPLNKLFLDYGAIPQPLKIPNPRMSPEMAQNAPGAFDSDKNMASILQQLQHVFPVKGNDNRTGDPTLNQDDKGRNVRFGAFQLG